MCQPVFNSNIPSFGSAAETSAPTHQQIVFIYSIIMKEKELVGTALVIADKDDVSTSNMGQCQEFDSECPSLCIYWFNINV